ncbi:MAG: flagellar export protein FliJ [Desulfovibrio sp.]|nr:flagellar export protein FliJ [Desulfovibrio sp.]
MAFRFNMQKVLDYRGQLEEEAKVRLTEAQRRQREAAQRLERLEAALREARDKARDTMMEGAAERWLHEGYVKGLCSDANEASLQLQMAGKMVDEARKLLTRRAIDTKTLDKLKARKKHQYAREELMREQHTNDETATLRFKAPSF